MPNTHIGTVGLPDMVRRADLMVVAAGGALVSSVAIG